MAAAQIRTTQRRPQRTTIYNGTNKFDYDKSLVPEGYEYGWKRQSVGGQEDSESRVMTEMNGWTPVPATRHPELVGRTPATEVIVRGGQMLMEIPKEWADDSREMDKFEARSHLEEQIQRLGLESRARGHSKGGAKRSMDVISGEIVS